MRIGYSLGPLLSAEEVLKCAVLADQKENVDSVWVPESWGRESFATLGAISQATRRIKIGTSIISIFSRTPATVAMGAVTLDMFSTNRTIIGLGSSTEAIVENWHGVKFEKPVSRMREFVECLNLMTSGERVRYAGNFFKVNNFKLLNAPPRKHVPVFMAAVNKKMVSLACELADGVILYLRPINELKRTVSDIRQSTSKNFEIALSLICSVSDNYPEKARRRAAKTLAFYIAVGKYYSKFLAENGFSTEVEKIKQAYGSGGDAAANEVTDNMLDALTVCGTSEQCRMTVSRFVDAGVTLPIIQVNPISNAEDSFREMLSTF